MRVSVGLILYIAVAIIGALIKRVAEDQQSKVKATVGKPGEHYSEDMSFGEIERALVQRFQEVPEPEQAQQLERIVAMSQDDPDDLEEEYFGEEYPEEERTLSVAIQPKPRTPSLHPNLAQAVVMSEIIRTPRSKRPWPSR